MAEIRSGLETLEQAVYETLALVLPGAVAILAIAGVVAPDRLWEVVELAGTHSWLAIGSAYLSGYVVQSLSRPVTNLTRAGFSLPLGALEYLLRRVSVDAASRLTTVRSTSAAWLRRGHAPKPEARETADVDIADVAHETWTRRLSLREGQSLRSIDVINLSFSTLGGEQKRLHRLRAVTSLCRAMAATVAVAFWLLGAALAGPWPVTGSGLGILLALALVFHAFIERADMYDALWSSIILPQYLANSAVGADAQGEEV